MADKKLKVVVTESNRISTEPGEPLAAGASGITHEVVDITPAMAGEWLNVAINRDNRSISSATVEKYKRDMLAGHWRVTHQGVAFGADGVLYDGQHRLFAIVDANVTVRMLVIRGLPVESRVAIDKGRGRSVADDFRMLDREPYGAKVVQWITSIERTRTKSTVPLSTEVVRGLRHGRYKAGVDWMQRHVGDTGTRLKRAALVGAFVYYYPLAPEKIAAAWRQYLDGAGLDKGHPMLTLRSFVLERAKDVRTDEMLRKALAALRAAVKGAGLAVLQDSEVVIESIEAEYTKRGL